MMKRVITGIIAASLMFATLTACSYTYDTSGSKTDTNNTINTASRLQANQPTPTDIDYSLERYNLIRRAYWVNGQREKAAAVICPIEKPLGYVVLFTESGSVIGRFIVDGKVSSLNSFLTPDSECYEIGGEGVDPGIYHNGTQENDWLADVDGSYGENDNGIFFFDIMGNYIEWTGTYLYTDIPMEISDPVVNFDVNYEE